MPQDGHRVPERVSAAVLAERFIVARAEDAGADVARGWFGCKAEAGQRMAGWGGL